jgi:hypothetical protein
MNLFRFSPFVLFICVQITSPRSFLFYMLTSFFSISAGERKVDGTRPCWLPSKLPVCRQWHLCVKFLQNFFFSPFRSGCESERYRKNQLQMNRLFFLFLFTKLIPFRMDERCFKRKGTTCLHQELIPIRWWWCCLLYFKKLILPATSWRQRPRTWPAVFYFIFHFQSGGCLFVSFGWWLGVVAE